MKVNETLLEAKRAELPANFAVGGQAVIEGVMMRGPDKYAVAVRRPQGDIPVEERRFWPITERKKWLKLPIVRGAVSLVEMLMLGYRALDYSANVYDQGLQEMEEKEKAEKGETAEPEKKKKPTKVQEEEEPSLNRSISRWTMLGMFVLSMGLGMLLFVALPNAATHLLGMLVPGGLVEVKQPLLYNLVAGGVRVLVIVGYVWAISLMPDVRRLFQYHGAEHKVVMAFERKLPLTLDSIRPVTTVHPRCGTTFIAVVLLVSIFLFALLAAVIVAFFPAFQELPILLRKPLIILLHIVCMPLVAGLAYEVTRRAGRNPHKPLYRLLLAPGLAFQKITTCEPDDDMVEVSLKSFLTALEVPFEEERESAEKESVA